MSAVWTGSAWVDRLTGWVIPTHMTAEVGTLGVAAMIARRHGLDAAADDLDLLARAMADKARAKADVSSLDVTAAAGRPPSGMV